MLCSSLADRRKKKLASTLFRIMSLPATSPLYEILMEQRAKKTQSSFFANAAAAHRLLFKQEPSLRAVHAFPPHIPPWSADFVPSKPRPTTSLTLFNEQATQKVRDLQSAQYLSHPHAEYYRQFRPSIDTKWRHADLKNHRNSRTLLRLRSGHSRLFMHDRIEEYSHCPCGPPLTAEHALLHCNLTPELSVRRQHLFDSLREFISFGEKPSLHQLLSAPKRSLSQQRKHLRLVAQFAQKLPYPP